MDKCIFTGRLAREVEVRQTGSGKSVANFTLAVDTGYGDNKKANFFNIVAFEKTAELIAAYFHKGDAICLETEAQQNSWTDKDGNKRYEVNFIVRSWEFCGSKANKEEQKDDSANPFAVNMPIEEELPFV